MNPNETNPELSTLLPAMLDGEMSDAEQARLADLLRDNPQAQQVYLDFCWTHALLRRELGVYGEVPFGAAGFSPPSEVHGDSQLNGGVRDIMSSDTRTPNPEPPVPPIVLDLSSTTHYPLPTSHFSVGSWAFSYMVATVIMGVAILGFWAYKITHHQHIAEAPSQSAPSDARPEMVFVGRITGMSDVKWSDDPHYLPPPDFAHVPLDRKYILSSGLLEITYDSGAKVILQGPCTYEVESTAGGYLALGKLTALVEKRGGKGSRSKVQGSRSKAEPSSFILHPSSLFSVRTPTAIVTDLGTEFGVEVNEKGNTTSRVFRGLVKVQVVGDGRKQDVILRENESARVEQGKGSGGPRLVLHGAVDNPPKFVRRLVEPPKVLDSLGTVDGSIFHDDFDGDAVDAGKWVVDASRGDTLSVAGGLMTFHTLADDRSAYLTGAAPLDFSGSPNDWWVEVRFKIGESLTTNSWIPRHWIVLGGSTVPPATREMQGFDLRVIQQGMENGPVFVLGWWGWDEGDRGRSPEWLVSNLKKGRFYIVKIHRKPDGNLDIYLDDRLIAVRPLIASQNPGVLRCGDLSGTYVNGKQIVDYVKVGALVP